MSELDKIILGLAIIAAVVGITACSETQRAEDSRSSDRDRACLALGGLPVDEYCLDPTTQLEPLRSP